MNRPAPFQSYRIDISDAPAVEVAVSELPEDLATAVAQGRIALRKARAILAAREARA